MNVTIAKSDLIRAITNVQDVAEKKGKFEALTHVLITASAGSLAACATDLETWASASVPAETTEPGSIALPPKYWLAWLKLLPEGPVQIQTGGRAHLDTARVLAGAEEIVLNGISGDNFPQAPAQEGTLEKFEVRGGTLTQLIGQTAYAMSDDEAGRPGQCAALLEGTPGILRVVTTDGHRLAKCEMDVAAQQRDLTVLVPRHGILALQRLARRQILTREPQTSIAISATHFFASAPGEWVAIKTLDVSLFPPYRMVMPDAPQQIAHINRADFARALKMCLAAKARHDTVTLEVSAEAIRVVARNAADEPLASAAVARSSRDAAVDLAIKTNGRYLLDAVNALRGNPEVALGFSGPLDACTVQLPADVGTSRAVALVASV